MKNLLPALWGEFLKARRSKLPLLTALGFSFIPLMGGFFMIVLQDPEMARRLGIVSAKAQIVAGAADWQTYLGILAQGTAIGGIMLFGIIASWVFGREYSDHTIKDLLALPTTRSEIVWSKFILIALWSAALVVFVYLIGLVVGALIRLPLGSLEIFWQSSITLAVVAAMMILLVTPIAFVASAGHGYLPPLGFAVFAVFFAQVIAAAGWGEYFPWSVPALRSGMAGPEYASMGIISYAIVVAASVVGMIATFVWWEWADQVY
jgi:ABC-type transport system involved in multi-copper enzyme maturation permease subunit